jgi:hypothetical protein
LLNSLGAGLACGKDDTRALRENAKISPTARAQTLSLNDWHNLYQQVIDI